MSFINKSCLTFVFFLFCYTFVTAEIKCLENKECPVGNYCTGSPEKQIKGKCSQKENFICLQNSQCSTTHEICHKVNSKKKKTILKKNFFLYRKFRFLWTN